VRYRAVFIDIDGTLRDDKKKVSLRTINAIKNVVNSNCFVVLCSGRGQKYTEQVSKECNASNYIITSSGSNVYDYKNKEYLFQNAMNKNSCIELYRIAKEMNLRFSMNVEKGIVTNKLKYFDGSEIELIEPIEKFVEYNTVFQCNIATKEYEIMKLAIPFLEKVKDCEIKNKHKSLVNSSLEKSGDIYCDIGNIGSCKGDAIEKFCRALNIDLDDTVGIGDDCNDISMFEKVGYSVVMGNASDEIKKYGDEVTLTNNDDGVAVFLEKLI